jgi:hypothetical protein
VKVTNFHKVKFNYKHEKEPKAQNAAVFSAALQLLTARHKK